jgi:hypothetical protein
MTSAVWALGPGNHNNHTEVHSDRFVHAAEDRGKEEKRKTLESF